MKKAHLYTATGNFVVAVAVPPFVLDPEVICWGSRTFERIEEEGGVKYYECFAYTATQTWEQHEKAAAEFNQQTPDIH